MPKGSNYWRWCDNTKKTGRNLQSKLGFQYNILINSGVFSDGNCWVVTAKFFSEYYKTA